MAKGLVRVYNLDMNDKAIRKKIVVCGNYGVGNYGDEAILAGILKTLKMVEQQVDVLVMSSNPEVNKRIHGVESVRFVPSGLRSLVRGFGGSELRKTREVIRNCDLFILGGGGLLNDDEPRAIWIWFVQSYWARRYGKKIACLGQSVGPLRHGWTKWLAKKIFAKAEVITVRDEKSLEVLQSIGINNARKTADFVFGLEPICAKAVEPYIVVSLRTWGNMDGNFLQEFVNFLDWLVATKKIHLKLLPFQKNIDDDETFLQKIKAMARHGNLMEILAYDENFIAARSLISGANAVIGMRLHALIFAALENVPFLGVAYSEKVEAMGKVLGMERHILNPKNTKIVDYQKAFELLMNDHEKIKIRLGGKVEIEKKLALEQVEILKRLLQ